MTENQIGFLFRAATLLSNGNNETKNILKSYYLMKCKEITRGYGLPQKHFSKASRCPQCCVEWLGNIETRVKPLKTSKKQRRRIRQHHLKNLPRNEVLHTNKLEQICCFCRHIITSAESKCHKRNLVAPIHQTNKTKSLQKKENKEQINPKNTMSVYCPSKDAFSLINKNNTLVSKIVEEKPKIKNCKKKKDKLAGLCQRAVLAANKLKLEKEKHNKINLFLKPSE